VPAVEVVCSISDTKTATDGLCGHSSDRRDILLVNKKTLSRGSSLGNWDKFWSCHRKVYVLRVGRIPNQAIRERFVGIAGREVPIARISRRLCCVWWSFGGIPRNRIGASRPYSWSRVIQQAARRASRRSPQPPVNNSAQTQSLPVNNTVVYSRIRPPFARGAGVTNSRPQASSFDGRLSHPGASPRPKTNPQMTSVNSHPIRTSLDLGPRGFPINLIVKGILS